MLSMKFIQITNIAQHKWKSFMPSMSSWKEGDYGISSWWTASTPIQCLLDIHQLASLMKMIQIILALWRNDAGWHLTTKTANVLLWKVGFHVIRWHTIPSRSNMCSTRRLYKWTIYLYFNQWSSNLSHLAPGWYVIHNLTMIQTINNAPSAARKKFSCCILSICTVNGMVVL